MMSIGTILAVVVAMISMEGRSHSTSARGPRGQLHSWLTRSPRDSSLGLDEELVHRPVVRPTLRAAKIKQVERALKAHDWRQSIYAGVDRATKVDPDTPTQIKLSFIPQGMAVNFATANAYVAPAVPTVTYGTDPNNLAFTATGPNGQSYGTAYFHTVLLEQLQWDTRYYYLVAGTTQVLSFVSGKEPGDETPFTVLIVGDMGLDNSNNTMAQMTNALNTTDFFMHIGDLSYADDFFLRLDTYEGTWDQWLDEMEPITSVAPYMTLPGNHEITCSEVTPFLCPPQQRNLTAYRYRFRMPNEESGGTDNLWFSYDYGLVHFIHIDTETDFPNSPMGPGTLYNGGPFGDQLTWLENDLIQAVANRKDGSVPWIIVSGHRPLYSSRDHNDAVVTAFESLFFQYGVDMYFSGHVHYYERLWPCSQGGVVQQQNYVNPTGIVYIINGAAGNVEGHEQPTKDPLPFSAYIDDTDYGYGKLYVANSTALNWSFFRAADNSLSDSIWITKTH